MAKMTDMEAAKTKRVLVYGPPKSGKTELVGGLAKHKELIWFDLENGRDTLFKLPPEDKANIEMLAIPDTKGYPIAVETCLKVIKGAEVWICEEHGKVNCVKCFDIKTKTAKEGKEVTRVCLNELRQDQAVVFDSITQLTSSAKANIARNKPDDYKFEFDDWAKLGNVLDNFLSYVQNAPYNVVCISHETGVTMVDGKEKIVPTAGTQNFSRNSAKYFGEVVYCEVTNKKHKAASSTAYKNSIVTGSRSGTVMEDKEKPELFDLFK